MVGVQVTERHIDIVVAKNEAPLHFGKYSQKGDKGDTGPQGPMGPDTQAAIGPLLAHITDFDNPHQVGTTQLNDLEDLILVFENHLI